VLATFKLMYFLNVFTTKQRSFIFNGIGSWKFPCGLDSSFSENEDIFPFYLPKELFSPVSMDVSFLSSLFRLGLISRIGDK